VSFHPLPEPYMGEPIDASASLYVPEEISEATHSFRAFGSGIANRWTVLYGARLSDFAMQTLDAAFRDLRLAPSPEPSGGSDVFVRLVSASYDVSGQAALAGLELEAFDAAGAPILAERYDARGSAGFGAVTGGGAFAQKGVVRSSTDEALRVIFGNLVTDLRTALRTENGDG